jgi:hypothetical protein
MEISAEALAKEVGIGRTTLWRWTRAGLLPQPRRHGRQALYSPVARRQARLLAEAVR